MKAMKYRLYPTKSQKELLAKHFGCVRYIYNHCLNLKTEIYQTEEKGISAYDLINRVTVLKKEEETKWLKEVNSQALQMSIKNLDTAFTNFFRKQTKYPKFKSKHNKQSFSCPQHCNVDFESGKTYIPKFREGIKTVFHREFEGKVKTCTISKTQTGKYYISILIDDGKDQPELEEPIKEKCLGIDLGISHYCIDSEGNKTDNPKHLKKRIKKLKREQRKLSRKVKGSNNRKKQRKKLAIVHEKAANSRKDFLHKLSHKIAENQSYNCVAMETLNIQGMMKNHKLAGSIGDVGWYMFQTFLEYKLNDRGKQLMKIGQFQPSSKLCSCGYKNKELKLKDREWTCPKCGKKHDRDVLAANNIKRFAFLEQNTKFIGKGLSEFTPVEMRGYSDKKQCSSLKQEAYESLA
jgi:putative transposase